MESLFILIAPIVVLVFGFLFFTIRSNSVSDYLTRVDREGISRKEQQELLREAAQAMYRNAHLQF